MKRRQAFSLWGAGLGLGAVSVGCGLALGLDYDQATVGRAAPPSVTADAGCRPHACDEDECGFLDDGCGGVRQCPGCSDGTSCVVGRCRCNALTCKARGAACGPVDDGCGKGLDCGACTVAQQSCTGDNQCTCLPRPCPDGGAGSVSCGSAPSGCDAEYACGGDCPLGPDGDGGSIAGICGGGGQNLCGSSPCTARTCQPGDCGQKSNGCDGVLDCGGCDGGTCGARGAANRCGCEPTTCARLGLGCGPTPDGCGLTLDCGSCTAPETCRKGGVCACDPIPAATACADQTCGFASDGCRGYHACGPRCPEAEQ